MFAKTEIKKAQRQPSERFHGTHSGIQQPCLHNLLTCSTKGRSIIGLQVGRNSSAVRNVGRSDGSAGTYDSADLDCGVGGGSSHPQISGNRQQGSREFGIHSLELILQGAHCLARAHKLAASISIIFEPAETGEARGKQNDIAWLAECNRMLKRGGKVIGNSCRRRRCLAGRRFDGCDQASSRVTNRDDTTRRSNNFFRQFIQPRPLVVTSGDEYAAAPQ